MPQASSPHSLCLQGRLADVRGWQRQIEASFWIVRKLKRKLGKELLSHSMIQGSLMPRGWVTPKPFSLATRPVQPMPWKTQSQRRTLYGKALTFLETKTGKPKEDQREDQISQYKLITNFPCTLATSQALIDESHLRKNLEVVSVPFMAQERS